jgi:uncharacterized DUF497 family protein
MHKGFERDEAKSRTNRAKHRVDFTAACRIFGGPVLEWIDDRRPYGEVRWLAVGRAGDVTLVVAWTWRGDKRRLISARKANRHERQIYEERIAGLDTERPGPG